MTFPGGDIGIMTSDIKGIWYWLDVSSAGSHCKLSILHLALLC